MARILSCASRAGTWFNAAAQRASRNNPPQCPCLLTWPLTGALGSAPVACAEALGDRASDKSRRAHAGARVVDKQVVAPPRRPSAVWQLDRSKGGVPANCRCVGVGRLRVVLGAERSRVPLV